MGLDNPVHILMVLVVVLLLFGAKRLPELGHGLGQGMRSFKDAVGGSHEQFQSLLPGDDSAPTKAGEFRETSPVRS